MANYRSGLQPYPSIQQSQTLWDRATKLIPAGTQTLAKGPTQWVKGVAPKYLARGLGSHVWDVDGNEYVDLNMAIGPISLGYAYPAVDNAIRAQLENGITFSLMHPLEVEVAELISEVIPGAESVRFSKTGCDVTSAAIRLARAYTGRKNILCCGYHGWHDWHISVTDRARGIPAEVSGLTFTFDYNNLDSVAEAIDDSIAAVILEPTVFETPNAGFLAGLRELCDRHGALLIFDEMWTGFRLALGGAQEHFGVRADLACFSKAIANGMPLSVLCGRADVMQLLEREVFFFTTFGGEALSLAAARATIGEMMAMPVLKTIARQGKRLKDGYNEIASESGCAFSRCVGADCRSMVTFDGKKVDPLLARSFVQQEMLRFGVLWNASHNVSYSHSDADVDTILSAYAAILPELAALVANGDLTAALRGEAIEPSFRRTAAFHTKRRVAGGKVA